MPSLRHELLVDLFRQDPHILLGLIKDALGPPLPPYTTLRAADVTLSQPLPAELRADLVVQLLSEEKPVLALIVEVQLAPDPLKRYTWPAYCATLRARLCCPALLCAVAGTEAVAAWAAVPIDDGLRGGVSLTPLVLGPRHVPIVTEPAKVREAPELGVLSLVAHAEEAVALTVADAVLAGLRYVAEPAARVYYDVVVAILLDLSRRKLLEKHTMDALLDKYRDHLKGLFAEGEAYGEARGEARGRAKDIVRLLRLRGLVVGPDLEAHILCCEDVARLDRWFSRALTVSSAAELIAD